MANERSIYLFSKFVNNVQHIVVSISQIAPSVFFLSFTVPEEHPYRQYSWGNFTEKSSKDSNLGCVMATCKFTPQKILPKRTLCPSPCVVSHYHLKILLVFLSIFLNRLGVKFPLRPSIPFPNKPIFLYCFIKYFRRFLVCY